MVKERDKIRREVICIWKETFLMNRILPRLRCYWFSRNEDFQNQCVKPSEVNVSKLNVVKTPDLQEANQFAIHKRNLEVN